MKNTIRAAALSASMLIMGPGGAALAQHGGHGGGGGTGMSAPSMPAIRTGKVKGTLVSKTDSSLTVQSVQKGESRNSTYLLDARTKFKGELQEGVDITVKYIEQDGVQKASSVEVKKPKAGRKS